jgi:hypothetical protein
LSTHRGYHYFKRAWKSCLAEANGDVEHASLLVKNILVHCKGECNGSCFWHGDNYKHTFGPFKSTEALAVIESFCNRWSDIETIKKYISGNTTNFMEYTNSLEGFFNLKVKHNKTSASYDLIAYYVSALVNLGEEVIVRIVKEVGLPWESTQEELLSIRIREREENSQRKKSDDYLSRRSELVMHRKQDTAIGQKDTAYKSVDSAQKHTVDKQKEKPQRKRKAEENGQTQKTKKAKKTLERVFKCGELVFVQFGTLYFYGVVLSQNKESSEYELYFIDEDTISFPAYELKSLDVLQKKKAFSTYRFWNESGPSVPFTQFPKEKYEAVLLDYFKFNVAASK